MTGILNDAAADCSSGCVEFTTDFTAGSLLPPNGIAVDALGNIWVVNSSVTEILKGASSDCSCWP